MKVNIGPYIHYYTTRRTEDWWYRWRYDKFDFEVDDKDRLDLFVEWILDKWQDILNLTINQIQDRRKRKEKIHIDNYDTWGMDHTLALIILPMLKQLQATKHGAPITDDSDVPEELRSTNAPQTENEWDTDDLFFKRWDWIMNEMIFAFEHIIDTDWEHELILNDKEAYDAIQKRIEDGLHLFGKYYRGLWD